MDRSSGGAGLGLAIVRELVAAMGGKVSAASVVGEGSRFSFSLPFVQQLPHPLLNGQSRAALAVELSCDTLLTSW